MRLLELALPLLLLGFVCPAAQPQGGNKCPLVIGVNDYLDNPAIPDGNFCVRTPNYSPKGSLKPRGNLPRGRCGREGRRAESSAEGLRPPKADGHVQTQGTPGFVPDDTCTQDDR